MGLYELPPGCPYTQNFLGCFGSGGASSGAELTGRFPAALLEAEAAVALLDAAAACATLLDAEAAAMLDRACSPTPEGPADEAEHEGGVLV